MAKDTTFLSHRMQKKKKNQAGIHLEASSLWLASTVLEGAMHNTREKPHEQSYPAVTPVSKNNDGPSKISLLVQ